MFEKGTRLVASNLFNRRLARSFTTFMQTQFSRGMGRGWDWKLLANRDELLFYFCLFLRISVFLFISQQTVEINSISPFSGTQRKQHYLLKFLDSCIRSLGEGSEGKMLRVETSRNRFDDVLLLSIYRFDSIPRLPPLNLHHALNLWCECSAADSRSMESIESIFILLTHWRGMTLTFIHFTSITKMRLNDSSQDCPRLGTYDLHEPPSDRTVRRED